MAGGIFLINPLTQTANMRRILLISIIVGGSAGAQDFSRIERDFALKREEATQRLREAIVGLREARQTSCTLRRSHYCDLFELSSIELTLLDLETKYRLIDLNQNTPGFREKSRKIQGLASAALSKVSDLATAIDESVKP